MLESTSPDLIDPADLPQTVEQWETLIHAIGQLQKAEYYHVAWVLARSSLYFLMRCVLSTSEWVNEQGKPFIAHQYILDFCNDVQNDYDDVLDVAARGHIKSYTKTFAFPIWKLMREPELTVVIFSFTRALAKKFLNVIKMELESNELLKLLSFDFGRQEQVFWSDPAKESKTWGLDDGILVNRRGNAREMSVEAHGLIDSMPTGRHWLLRLYDDCVTKDNVTTSEQVRKATESWHYSHALGMPGGQASYTGTFYLYGDTHTDMVKSGIRLRLRPCYELKSSEYDDDGLPKNMVHDTSKPVLFTKEYLDKLEKTMSPATWGTQYLCDIHAGLENGFLEEWLKWYEGIPSAEAAGKTVYILVDPAGSKKKDSSYTVMWVVGLGDDGNRYVLDCVRDRLNLKEKGDTLFSLHRIWKPIEVRYERYSMQADIQYLEERMELEKYRFYIREVSGSVMKDDRIARLVPLFLQGMIYLPRSLKKVRVDGTKYDPIDEFVNQEYVRWPSCDTKDMLDALARIDEPGMSLVWPKKRDMDQRYDNVVSIDRGSWMVS